MVVEKSRIEVEKGRDVTVKVNGEPRPLKSDKLAVVTQDKSRLVNSLYYE